MVLLLSAGTVLGQMATPTVNPFMNNGGMTPQFNFNGSGYQRPSQQQFFPRQQFFPQQQLQRPNNFMLGRPNVNYGFQNNFQRPQQQFFPQGQQQIFPQGQQQFFPQGQQQPQRTQTNNVPLFTRRYYLNNGYLFGRPTLYYDPKSGQRVPWVRRNLR